MGNRNRPLIPIDSGKLEDAVELPLLAHLPLRDTGNLLGMN